MVSGVSVRLCRKARVTLLTKSMALPETNGFCVQMTFWTEIYGNSRNRTEWFCFEVIWDCTFSDRNRRRHYKVLIMLVDLFRLVKHRFYDFLISLWTEKDNEWGFKIAQDSWFMFILKNVSLSKKIMFYFCFLFLEEKILSLIWLIWDINKINEHKK